MPKPRRVKLITPTEFAEQIAVRRQAVFAAIKNGRLPVYDKTASACAREHAMVRADL
jgi:hypothetical protein